MFNGERLRDIRMAYGLSRKELADLIGISEQAVWQYENSTINPRIDIISKFSLFFSVDSRYFLNKNKFHYVVREDSIAYRNVDREQRTKTSSEAMYLEFVNDLIVKMNSKYYGISLLINEIADDIEKKRLEGKSIEDCASYVRQAMNIETNRDLLLRVEQAGVIVLEKKFNTKKTDAYSTWVENFSYIVLGSSRKTAVRRNFDLAHELGHLVLHRKIRITDLTKEEFRKIENEANEFASNFLLPKDDFLKDMAMVSSVSNPNAYIDLKKKYYVSIAAMGVRAANLNKMTYNQKKYFFSNLNKFGYKVLEPYDDSWEIPRPKFLLSFIEFLDENGLLKFSDLLSNNFYELKFVSKLFSIDESALLKYIKNSESKNMRYPLLS